MRRGFSNLNVSRTLEDSNNDSLKHFLFFLAVIEVQFPSSLPVMCGKALESSHAGLVVQVKPAV